MIERADEQDVALVWHRMRAADREEITAEFGHCDPGLMRLCLQPGARPFVVRKDGEPVAIVGAVPQGYGVASMFRFATDRWQDVVGEVIRFGRRRMPAVFREMDCTTAVACTLNIPSETRWLRLFGAKEMSSYSKNGRNFAVFRRFVD